ncbi:MAG: hypothetical protein HGA71_09805 [Azonexaceae bacterium]|nr:hypothetical protein [Azonexaceae bacterium]
MSIALAPGGSHRSILIGGYFLVEKKKQRAAGKNVSIGNYFQIHIFMSLMSDYTLVACVLA